MLELNFDTDSSVQGWTAIDDRVMGGASLSRLRFDAGGFAVFEGQVSTDNGGGFASVRHPALRLGGRNVQGYRLTVRGDGRRYKINLRTDHAFDAVQYQADFQVEPGIWSELELPVSAFTPRFRGQALTGHPPMDASRVCRVGFMIAERQAGDFRLEISCIICY